MDLDILYLTSIFAFFLFLFLVHKILSKKPNSTPNLPPGPWKLPIIGNIHNLVGSIPHRRLRDLSIKYGPLMHLKLGEVCTIIVSSPEYAKEVMKTHDVIFASRPPILGSKILMYDSKSISFSPYGDYWRQLRKISTLELLSSKRVNSFQPVREEELGNLIKWIASKEGSLVNFSKEVISTTSLIISRTAFGKKCKYQQEFVSVMKEAIEFGGGFDLGDLFPSTKWLHYISNLKPKLEKLHKQSDLIMQTIINEHREAKSKATKRQGEEAKEDLIDVLLKFQDSSQQENYLTDDSIKAVIWDIFGGGSETSSTTVVWAMTEMIKYPRVMKKLQAEVRDVFDREGKVDESSIEKLKYLKLVVKETLRLHPPVTLLLPRECGQACEINGYHIPIKSKVLVNAWALGRDPNYWTEPDRFFPERFTDSSIDYKGNNLEFIPFGAGRRMCPGITFGLINVELALALLLYHFDWNLPKGLNNEDLDMTETFGATTTRKDDLYLIPVTSRPLPTVQPKN